MKKNILRRGGNNELAMLVSDSKAYLDTLSNDIDLLQNEINTGKDRLGSFNGYRINSGVGNQTVSNFKFGAGNITDKSTDMGLGMSDRDGPSKGLFSNRSTKALLLKENRKDLGARGETDRKGMKKYSSGMFMPSVKEDSENKGKQVVRNVQTARPGGY